MNTITRIIVTLQVEGIHFWPGCDIPEVNFLKYPHRHIFHIRAEKEVLHDDRDIEIIMYKRQIEAYIKEKYYKPEARCAYFGQKSCEQLAREIMEKFQASKVSVMEDNENGAIIEEVSE